LFQKVTQGHIDDVKPEMVAPVDERSSALEFLDEESEEMRLIRVVETLNTSF
jgi:hypothetical protein